MGAVQGHMSHLYDNPNLRFSQIKDVFQKASRGELVGTEKTDGQNLMVSYDVRDNTARASRNKGHFQSGGLSPDELQTFFGGRGNLEHSFSDAFRAFETMARRLPEEAKIKLFGPEANIYYNAEIQDPRTSNVINYDVATLTIHRKGHGEYDKNTGALVKDIPEEYATYLESLLDNTEADMENTGFRVQVNAIRNLERLANDSALEEATIRLDKFMSSAGVSDNNTIGEYLVRGLDLHVTAKLPDLDIESKKLLMKRMFQEAYGTENKKRKVTLREIFASLEDPNLKGEVRSLIDTSKTIVANLIYPLEDIIHDFAVEMLRGLESAFILDSPGELERQKEEVRKAIEAIESSGNEDALLILQHQMKKLKNIENMTTAAEGFVFDYDGHTYKFTGNFAPANQILGLFKYGRKGIPPLQAINAEEILYEKLDYVISSEKPFVALFPGKFKPPHSGHLGVVKELANNHGVAKVIVLISPRTHAGISAEQSKQIWELFLKGTPMAPKVEVEIADAVSPVGAVYDYIDSASSSLPVLLAVGQKDKEDGRYAQAVERGKNRQQRLNLPPIDVAIDDIPPQAGGVCATDIRNAMAERSSESMKKVRECLPYHISPEDKAKIMKLMEPGAQPLAETFRSSDLFGMIEEILDEQKLREGPGGYLPSWLKYEPGPNPGAITGVSKNPFVAHPDDPRRVQRKKEEYEQARYEQEGPPPDLRPRYGTPMYDVHAPTADPGPGLGTGAVMGGAGEEMATSSGRGSIEDVETRRRIGQRAANLANRRTTFPEYAGLDPDQTREWEMHQRELEGDRALKAAELGFDAITTLPVLAPLKGPKYGAKAAIHGAKRVGKKQGKKSVKKAVTPGPGRQAATPKVKKNPLTKNRELEGRLARLEAEASQAASRRAAAQAQADEAADLVQWELTKRGLKDTPSNKRRVMKWLVRAGVVAAAWKGPDAIRSMWPDEVEDRPYTPQEPSKRHTIPATPVDPTDTRYRPYSDDDDSAWGDDDDSAEEPYVQPAPKYRNIDENRREDEEELYEMSSMGGGSVEGGMIGTGSKAGPWADLDVEKENEKQKKHQKLKGESLSEELIDEILDYLIHAEV